ncbi:hypothetical protein C8R47DRAFT_962284 [Mycena vitilis]|nr:hypothetical protein C8R47DRAFT_962284 [Mycena vitilis]
MDHQSREREAVEAGRGLAVNLKPLGLVWDSINYSCAYDAMFTILGNLWAEDAERWSTSFIHLSTHLGDFAVAMRSVLEGRITFEQARNVVRRSLRTAKPDVFPNGRMFTSVDRLAEAMLPSKFYAVGRQGCTECGHDERMSYGMLESHLTAGLSTRTTYPDGFPLQHWLHRYLTEGRRPCPVCAANGVRCRLTMATTLRDVPPIMIFDLIHDKLLFDEVLTFDLQGVPANLRLRGIIYGGQSHFTCRLIGKNGTMWFHDGITTAKDCIREVNIRSVHDRLSLHKCGEKKAVALVYAREF